MYRQVKRSGLAILPLHQGKAPKWLFNRMKKLARAIAEAIVLNYDEKTLLYRLADPYWFQALGCLLGFDWHSSGLTTTTIGALKQALQSSDIPIRIAGGKSPIALKTPEELIKICEEFNIPKAERFVNKSRVVAKVDNALIQDSFSLYHHAFIIDSSARWVVIQQGLNPELKIARRYHWIHTANIIVEPHEKAGIISEAFVENTLDLTSKQSSDVRKAMLDLCRENPLKVLRTHCKQSCLLDFSQKPDTASFKHFKTLVMPRKHSLTFTDLNPESKQLLKSLKTCYELQPNSFEELLNIKGVGLKTFRALALTSELVFGVKASWKDPAKYSFAHGGKDGWPFPVDKNVYDSTIEMFTTAVKNAKLGDKEKLFALQKLFILAKTKTV